MPRFLLATNLASGSAPFLVLLYFLLQWLIGDRDSHCGGICSRTQGKPVCGSDGRSYETSCELQRAHCKDKTLTLAYRGRCRGKTDTQTET